MRDIPHAHWELQMHAALVILENAKPPLMTDEELRRGIEVLDQHTYDTWSYYERWAASISAMLIERGVITTAELHAELGLAHAESTDVQFGVGDVVRIRHEDPTRRFKKPHLRTPGYVFGLRGEVTRYLGLYPDPGLAAFRLPAPRVPLYSVRISLSDIKRSRYYKEEADVEDGDVVELDVFQPWLDRVKEEEDVSASLNEGVSALLASLEGHDHDHDHDHVHSSRSETERIAHQREGSAEAADCPGRRLAEALLSLLQQKGMVSPAQLTSTIDRLESRGREMKGADLVVAAWTDETFKQELLHDANAAALSLGIVASSDASTKLIVCENTPETHHVIVCTLCSCYPSALLGLSPAWYKSASYRARVVRQPRQVLLEAFGTTLPSSQRVVVHDSTADCRYLVLPMRPAGSEGLDREALRAIVTRDSLLGVRVLQ